MTWSNWMELAVLIGSLIAVICIVRFSNQKVNDLDGLGEITEKDGKEGTVVAHF